MEYIVTPSADAVSSCRTFGGIEYCVSFLLPCCRPWVVICNNKSGHFLLLNPTASCRLEVSAGWLDLGLDGVVIDLEYIVTPSAEHAVSSYCAFVELNMVLFFLVMLLALSCNIKWNIWTHSYVKSHCLHQRFQPSSHSKLWGSTTLNELNVGSICFTAVPYKMQFIWSRWYETRG